MVTKHNENTSQMSNNDILRTTTNCNSANKRKIVNELLLSDKCVLKKISIKKGRKGIKIVNMTLEILSNNDESQIEESIIEQMFNNTKRKTDLEQKNEGEMKNKCTLQKSDNNNGRNSLSSSDTQSLKLENENKYIQSHIQVKDTKSLEKTKNIPEENQNDKNILQPDNKNLSDTALSEQYRLYAAQILKEVGTVISPVPQSQELDNNNKTNTHNKNELMTPLLMNPHSTITLNKNKNTIPYQDEQPSNIEALNNNINVKNSKRTPEKVSKQIIPPKRKNSPKRSPVVAKLKKKSNSLNTPTSTQNFNSPSSSAHQMKKQSITQNDLPMPYNGPIDHIYIKGGKLFVSKLLNEVNIIENMKANQICKSQTLQSPTTGYSDKKCLRTMSQNFEQPNTQYAGVVKTEMNDDFVDLT